VRIAYRASYLLFILSARVAACLAADFRALSRASRRWGALVVLLQLPVLLVWFPARALSLASFAVCETIAGSLQ
jgi:hypothetical protein